MGQDSGLRLETLRVDGGAAENDFLMQFQADILGAPVRAPGRRSRSPHSGAALLAGLGVGFWNDRSANWRALDGEVPGCSSRSYPHDAPGTALYAGWKRAVDRSLAPGKKD